ncbi:hypothetical protein LUZ60_002158 [Juncus effusus]|nr:hypothetical protein LUZ60_002158 [Juncus effusus]
MSSNRSTLARLLDTGNLVLTNMQGVIVWQSFDHPTDTYIPGMRVGLDLQTGVNQVFRSWKSDHDPSPGNFTLGIDPDRSTQLYVWEGSQPRWRSGRWNGQIFIGIEKMIPSYMYAFKMSNYDLEKKMYFYTVFNLSHIYRISWDGIDEHRLWTASTKSWTRSFAQPTSPCEFYNRCGDYATCTERNGEAGIEPACECLKGHVPVNETEWRNGIVTSGCVRRVMLNCEKRGLQRSDNNSTSDEFWRMKNVKLPDLSVADVDVVDETGCQAKCLRNCSCKAYSFVTGIGCLIWNTHLIDMHIFTGGGGNDMFLRLDSTELGFLGRGKVNQNGSSNRNGSERSGSEFSGVIQIIDHEGKQSRELPLLRYDSIAASTENFSSKNLLGEGGFGPVYKGICPEGQEVAVKRLSKSSCQGLEEFKNEVILIAKLQHRNLVKLLGCCIENEEKILIYEFMPNRSLDGFLFDPIKKKLLDWKTSGYMSPEYAMQGIFSVKSDVYSFGVLILEIISGRKNTTFYNHELSLYLLGYAWKLWHEDNLIQLVDPAIRDSFSLNQVATCVNVGLLCVQDHVNDRPTMSSVLIMLESGVTATSAPKEPTFSAVKGPTNTDSSTFELANASMSMLIGR